MRFFSSVHLLLLAYVVVALVFWEFSLQKQSVHIYEQEVLLLKREVDSVKTPDLYLDKLNTIQTARTKRTKQYIGEGSTFLVVILIGAFVVYKSFKRRITLSRQQNNFMLSVTHELKSPIAGIKLNLQTIEKHKLDDDKRKVLIERSIKEANRLNDLCNNMLYASRLEGGQYKPTKELFDFSEMARDCANDYAARYPQRFEQEISEDCSISGDKMMLQIAMSNLLENAIKYSPAETPVTVRVTKLPYHIQLEVIDRGNGVPDHEKKKIFNKFYRIGNEESRKTKGTGLGLYLTSRIVQQHNGQISVKDNKPTGTIFEILIPIGRNKV